jgi:outer membrane protein OmpA-like peptidoglycan-associated protein
MTPRIVAATICLALALACAGRSENQRLADELAAENFDTRVDERGVTVFVPNVLFDFDSDELTELGRTRVAAIAQIAARVAPGRRLVAEGHTDGKGTEAYNQDLSERRANRVREALVAGGMAAETLSSVGYGETRPIASETLPDGSDDPDGRQRNRRVEVVIENR